MNNFFDTLAKGGDKDKKNNTKNAVIYTRVSSKEQAENNMSLDTQLTACIKYADRDDLIIKQTFGGTHESAKTDDRPQFKELLEYVNNPKNGISYLLVYSFDRFSRSGISGANIIARLIEVGVEVISVTQPIDSSNPAGRLQQNILMMFNEFDNQLRRQKTIEGMKAALERGDWITLLTVGYSKDKNTGKVYINEKGHLIKEGFELFVQGFKISQLVTTIASKGLLLTKQRWSNILQNPFYCGYISHKLLEGKIVIGNHPPLVPQELFQRVHEIRKSGNRLNAIKTVNTKHPLKGFVKCQRCGTSMTGYEQKGNTYYKCNKKGCCHNASGKQMISSFKKYLKKFELNSRYTEVITSFLQTEFNVRNETLAQKKKSVDERVRNLITKKKQLETKFLYSDSVSENLYNSENERLANELNDSTSYSEKLNFELSNSKEFIDYGVSVSSELNKIWSNGDYETKVKLQNLVFPDGISFEKETDTYRTTRTNPIFGVILSLSAEIEEKRKGRLTVNAKSSLVVAGTGLEPVTFGL